MKFLFYFNFVVFFYYFTSLYATRVCFHKSWVQGIICVCVREGKRGIERSMRWGRSKKCGGKVYGTEICFDIRCENEKFACKARKIISTTILKEAKKDSLFFMNKSKHYNFMQIIIIIIRKKRMYVYMCVMRHYERKTRYLSHSVFISRLQQH